MNKIIGGCFALGGLLIGFKLAYDNYVDKIAVEHPWYYFAAPVVLFLIGVAMLSKRE